MDKVPLSELEKRLQEVRKQLVPGSRWQHYKGGMYELIDVVIIEADMQIGVIYRPLENPRVSFFRPLPVWQEPVTWQGQTVPRFKNLTKVSVRPTL
jgi:hypothetical protein